MKIKSLLAATALVALSSTALAENNFTIYPEDGALLDDTYYLQNIAITPQALNYSVSENAYAILQCDETGDEFESSDFYKFDGAMEILIKFEDAVFTDNGSYTLIIPAGQFTINGVENERLVFHYTLEDPKLAMGDFPQIDLVSVDPADGSSFPSWGDDIGRVKFVTSNDAAVNYIEWKLLDVTDTSETKYVTSGNDNRIDPNRYNTDADQWADGLWIALSGDAKLFKDHKYALNVTFCGIGYDPASGQYPSPEQINLSKELQTTVTYYGLSLPTEYSPYVVESVSPDPMLYEITDADMGCFMVTYSGPVKPVSFIYPLGMGTGTAVAGTYEPVGDPDEAGYCDKWEFVIDPDVLKSQPGMLSLKLRAQDADGLYVKGNTYADSDDFDYEISWVVRVGMNELCSVSPENFANVEELSQIVVGNYPYGQEGQPGAIMNVSGYAMGVPTITTRFGEEIRVLGDAEKVEGNDTELMWQFEPITEPGTYLLHIPDMYFTFGEQFEASGNSMETWFTYVVGNPVSEVEYDLVPVSVFPTADQPVKELEYVELVFESDVVPICYPQNDYMSQYGKLYKVVDGELGSQVAEAQPFGIYADDYAWTTNTYRFTFESPITEEGVYRLVLEQGTFGDEAYDFSMYENGHASPAMEFDFCVGDESGVESVIGDAVSFSIVGISGVVIKNRASKADIDALPAGLYIINGKKVLKK